MKLTDNGFVWVSLAVFLGVGALGTAQWGSAVAVAWAFVAMVAGSVAWLSGMVAGSAARASVAPMSDTKLIRLCLAVFCGSGCVGGALGGWAGMAVGALFSLVVIYPLALVRLAVHMRRRETPPGEIAITKHANLSEVVAERDALAAKLRRLETTQRTYYDVEARAALAERECVNARKQCDALLQQLADVEAQRDKAMVQAQKLTVHLSEMATAAHLAEQRGQESTWLDALIDAAIKLGGAERELAIEIAERGRPSEYLVNDAEHARRRLALLRSPVSAALNGPADG